MRGLAVMRPPWGNMFEFATAGAAAAALAYCLLARRRHWEWLGLFVIGPILLILGLAMFAFYTEAAELMPALKSVWLVIHVVVAILAVAVFTIGFSIGIVYLVRRHREEHPPARRNFVESLPPAASLERAAYGLNMVGFILWTFTLVAGAIWAQKAWSAYWTWDPKEVWTFVIWVVYAAYMHARATAGWEPRKAMWIALAGYVLRPAQLHRGQPAVHRVAQLLGAQVVLRYTLYRLLIFFGCLLFFWLVGLRNDQVLLLLVSAVVSVVLSFFLLRSQRDQFSAQIADRMEKRQAAKREAQGPADPDPDSDEAVEDAEIEDARVEDARSTTAPTANPRRFPASNPRKCQVSRPTIGRELTTTSGRKLTVCGSGRRTDPGSHTLDEYGSWTAPSVRDEAGPSGRSAPARGRDSPAGRTSPSPASMPCGSTTPSLGRPYLLSPSSSTTVACSIHAPSVLATNSPNSSNTSTCGCGSGTPHSAKRTNANDSSHVSRRPSTNGATASTWSVRPNGTASPSRSTAVVWRPTLDGARRRRSARSRAHRRGEGSRRPLSPRRSSAVHDVDDVHAYESTLCTHHPRRAPGLVGATGRAGARCRADRAAAATRGPPPP